MNATNLFSWPVGDFYSSRGRSGNRICRLIVQSVPTRPQSDRHAPPRLPEDNPARYRTMGADMSHRWSCWSSVRRRAGEVI